MMPRFLSPGQLAPSTILTIIPPPQVLVRIFLRFTTLSGTIELMRSEATISWYSRLRAQGMGEPRQHFRRDGTGLDRRVRRTCDFEGVSQ